MKITRRNFGKVVAGTLAAMIVPFIPKIPSEDLAAREITKTRAFKDKVKVYTRNMPQITIKDYKIGETISYYEL